MASDTIKVGMLGFGTVGQGTYQMLADNHQEIAAKVGRPMEITKIAVRDGSKRRSLPAEMFTTDVNEILDDPEIQVVLELMGGVDTALDAVEKCMQVRKHVVTANKELIAKHGARLVSIARDRELDLHFEAAVGGGIPLVQPLKHQLAGNRLNKMMGILNGTCNYILTQMSEHGTPFDQALQEAQEAGYAEADPTNDVDGIDTLYKIAVLASIVFGKQCPLDQVYCEGIRNLDVQDLNYARLLGYEIKLLGICEEVAPERILVRVHPAMLPKRHPLASVEDVYNALWLTGDYVGDVMFSGKGAGMKPTASAVVGDLLDVGRNIVVGGSGSAIPYGEGLALAPMDEAETRYYIRFEVEDQPNVLGPIANVFGEHGVSLAATEMRAKDPELGEIVFFTHRCREAKLQDALAGIRDKNLARKVENVIRIEDRQL
ncbi:MAG: homoserine dehydrogenase [Fimbriimonadaceae bacterium]